MKKQAKGKRTPPRRKPIRKPIPQKTSRGTSGITLYMTDEMLAEQRAMHESMPPDVLAEYLRLNEIDRASISPEDDARLDKIFAEYNRPLPQDVMDRYVADIVRERGQSAAQNRQDGTAA